MGADEIAIFLAFGPALVPALGLTFAAWTILKGLGKFATIAAILSATGSLYAQGYTS